MSEQYSNEVDSCQPQCERWVDKCRSGLSRLLWPATCVLCGQRAARGFDLCEGCEADLPCNEPACAACAEPLSANAVLCGACLQHPPPFASSFVPFRYGYPLDHLVRALKFRNQLACGRALGELFARRLMLKRDEPLPEVIVPVPLAQRRFRERGYNQATELALAIRRVTRLPVRADLVFRQRETAEQAGLDRKQRLRNVRDAFAVVAPLALRHVAILDDVMTTGSTVAEIAQVLRRAGVEHVEAWAIARAGS